MDVVRLSLQSVLQVLQREGVGEGGGSGGGGRDNGE